jgi:predicted PurR-regulated permease PerM
MQLTDRQRQTLLWTAVGLVLIWALVALGPVLTPFAAAAILAYALQPTVEWMVKRRLPRVLAVSLTILLAILAVASLLLILAPIVQKEFVQIRAQLPALIANLTEKLNVTLLPWLNANFGLPLTLDASALRGWLTQHLSASGDDWAATLFNYLKSGGNTFLQILGFLFLVPVALFYLLLDWPKNVSRLNDLVPPRWQPVVQDWVSEINTLLGQYLRGQLLVMLCLAVLYSIALLLAGFQLWLPIGVLTGLLIAIPYLGFATGLIFALLAGMLQFGPAQGFLSVALIYGVFQVVESLVLTPRLVGERIGLHPLAVIFALIAFGYLFGFVGILLALPLAAVLAIALRRLRRGYLGSDFFARTD